jgi:hypothetical protein
MTEADDPQNLQQQQQQQLMLLANPLLALPGMSALGGLPSPGAAAAVSPAAAT